MVTHQVLSATGKLVLFDGPGKAMRLQEHIIPAVNDKEILVKNLYTTICGSDIHTYCGMRKEPCPTVLGHEIVGEIVEVGPGHEGKDLRGVALQKGDIVTWTVFTSNPDSLNSLAGMPQKGDNMFKYGHAVAAPPDVFHGGLAEYCILKANTAIIKISPELPLGIAATLNCSISTVAGALRMAGDLKGKDVLITGMGHLGITCAAMCKDAGARYVMAADISDKRLNEAMKFGADAIFNFSGDKNEIKESLQKKLIRKGFDVAFDMSGSIPAMEFGLDTLAIGGTAVWIGAVFNTPGITIDPQRIIRNLTTIRGLHNYNFEDFKYAVDFMERNWKKFPFVEAVEKEFPLSQTQDAFEYAIQHKPLRVGIRL